MNKRKRKAPYVNNERFSDIMIQWKKTNDKKLYEEIGKIFLDIATNLLNKPNFANYSYDRKGDMLSDATFYMTKYIKSYDVDRKNPFAYFSQIAISAFKQNINKVNKKRDIFISLEFLENMSREKD